MDHIGIDVHQRDTEVREMVEGQVVVTARVATTAAGLRRQFGRRERARIVLECGAAADEWRTFSRSSVIRWCWSIRVGCV